MASERVVCFQIWIHVGYILEYKTGCNISCFFDSPSEPIAHTNFHYWHVELYLTLKYVSCVA